MPVKKSKRKLQHKRAIAAYKKWERKHPHAPIERKAQEFDILVDSSALEEALDAVQATAA